MAVVKTPDNSRLIIKVQTGVSDAGNPVFRQRSFNNVKADAADADIYAVGQAIGGLQQHAVSSIGRIDEAGLLDQ
jgi:hypothetical protein